MKGPLRAIIVLVALASCVRPPVVETFIPVSDSVDGVYRFDVDFSDTSSVYDMYFFTRVDAEPVSVPLGIVWLSPSGESFEEVVYTQPVGPDGLKELYRSDACPTEPGVWKLLVRPVAPEGFRGLGFICEIDGTR